MPKYIYLTDGITAIRIRRSNILGEVREDTRHAPLVTRLGPLDLNSWLIVADSADAAKRCAKAIKKSPKWDIDGIEYRTGLKRSRVEFHVFNKGYRFPAWELP